MAQGAASKLFILAGALVVSCFPFFANGASFVVERSQMRVTGEGFAASFPSAIGDVSKNSLLLSYIALHFPGKINALQK
jgi:hypothetical protein